MKRIYLDHAATTPVHPEVKEKMLPFLTDNFGNPSSIHWFGREARKAVDEAREDVAKLIGANFDEVIFTAGGTEADNLAIIGSSFTAKENISLQVRLNIMLFYIQRSIWRRMGMKLLICR